MSTTTTGPRRGQRGAAAAADSRRLVPAARRRQLQWVLAGVVLVSCAGLAFMTISLRLSSTVAVLAVNRAVPVGHVLEESDLRVANVSTDGGISPIAANDEASILGRPAAVALVPGSLLTRGEVGSPAALSPGEVVIGAGLKPGQFPPALAAGDRVAVIDAGSADRASGAVYGGSIPARVTATVVAVDQPPAASGSDSIISLRLDSVAADTVARLAAAGRATLLLLPPGGGAG
jgi:hypothetical protein